MDNFKPLLLYIYRCCCCSAKWPAQWRTPVTNFWSASTFLRSSGLHQYIQRDFFHWTRRYFSDQATFVLRSSFRGVFERSWRGWRLSRLCSSGVRFNVKDTEMWPSATWRHHSEMDWPSALLFTNSDQTLCKSLLLVMLSIIRFKVQIIILFELYRHISRIYIDYLIVH